jgi:hypothetical protein
MSFNLSITADVSTHGRCAASARSLSQTAATVTTLATVGGFISWSRMRFYFLGLMALEREMSRRRPRQEALLFACSLAVCR